MQKSKITFLLVVSLLFFPGLLTAQVSTETAVANRVAADQAARIATQNRALADSYRPALLERFLRYVKYNSQSSETEPITDAEKETARKLFQEIKAMGLAATLTEHYYIYVEIPSNVPWQTPTLGFSCHYDVTPDLPAENVNYIVHKNYNGGPIELENGQVIDPAQDNGRYLSTQVGKTIVTSDGNTNLGADDKAGVSIMMTLLDTLAKHPNKAHGKLQIVFAPNEDVGRAAEFIEETAYHPDIAFDFDGGVDGEVVVENFNARQEIYIVEGTPGHQSHAAENGYRNAWVPACELGERVCPPAFFPNFSTDRQGYAELHHMDYAEKVSVARLDIRLRNYSKEEMDAWEKRADRIAEEIVSKYEVQIRRQMIDNYRNVGEVAHPQTLAITRRAFAAAGVPLKAVSERAGTTAAMFVTKGLVGAFTVFTGQNNPHAYTEWLSEEDMFRSYLVALNLLDEVAQLRSSN